MCIRSMSGNRESSEETVMRSHRQSGWGRPRPKSQHLCASEQSDRPIVPEKLSNKAPSIPIKSGPWGCGDGGGKGPDQGEPVKVRQVPYSVTEA